MEEELIVKRTAPHNEDAELSVIGAILMNHDAIETVSEIISGDDFYNRHLGIYFDTILQVYRSGSKVDAVTVQERVKDRNLPPEFTTVEYIRDMIAAVPTSANVKYYAQIIADNSTKRRLIRVCEDLSNDCFSGAKELDEILNEAEKRVFEISERQTIGEYTPIGTIVVEALSRIAKAGKNKGHVTGIATGFVDLDYDTAGMQPSDLVLIAARPSMGKSALALNMAEYMAFHDRKTVAMFSLEMSKEQLVNRLLSMESKVSSQNIRTGQLSDAEWERLVQGADIVGGSNLIFDDTPGISVAELRTKCRRYKMEHGLDAVFIDYLQLMSGGRSGRGSESRQQEISEISRGLKAVARELQVPVIALSQLSRAVEQRPDHRPMLSDLRESGAIEQDADVVMFIYREDYYNKDTNRKGIAEVIIAKQRNGPIGTIELLWMPEHQKFASLGREKRDGQPGGQG